MRAPKTRGVEILFRNRFDLLSRLYSSVCWTRQVLILAALKPLIPDEILTIKEDTERRRALSSWYRTAQLRSMDREGRKNYFRFNQYAATPEQTSAVLRAAYWSPTTYHRYFKYPLSTLDAGKIDTVPCIFVDCDYMPGPSGQIRRPPAEDVLCRLFDADLLPTMLVDTPRGYHIYYYLQEPLVMRWEKTGFDSWRPMPGAVRGLDFWRDVSFALHRRLLALGIPADTAGAAAPARLLRMPHRDERKRTAGGWCHHYESERRFTLDELNKTVEEYKMRRTLTIGGGRKISLSEGVEEGERNSVCWKLAQILASEYRRTPEAGWRALAAWCGRCSPAYPEAEARPVWRWALRAALAGRVATYKWETGERSRKEQGPYARKIVKNKIDEAVSAAVAAMQAEGISDPWAIRGGVKAIAERSGIPYRTIKRRKKDFTEKISVD